MNKLHFGTISVSFNEFYFSIQYLTHGIDLNPRVWKRFAAVKLGSFEHWPWLHSAKSLTNEGVATSILSMRPNVQLLQPNQWFSRVFVYI